MNKLIKMAVVTAGVGAMLEFAGCGDAESQLEQAETAIDEAADALEEKSINSEDVCRQYPDNKYFADLFKSLESKTSVQTSAIVKKLAGKQFKIAGVVNDVTKDETFNRYCVEVGFDLNVDVDTKPHFNILIAPQVEANIGKLEKGKIAVFVGEIFYDETVAELYEVAGEMVGIYAKNGNFAVE